MKKFVTRYSIYILGDWGDVAHDTHADGYNSLVTKTLSAQLLVKKAKPA